MSKTVSSLTLDDEHVTIGTTDTLQEAAKRLMTIHGGILIVLNDEQHVQGVIGQRQLIQSIADGLDMKTTQCHEIMEMDFMMVELEDPLPEVLTKIKQRSPQAVVAVDEQHEFVGYFSPNDYQEAMNLVKNLKSLNL